MEFLNYQDSEGRVRMDSLLIEKSSTIRSLSVETLMLDESNQACSYGEA